MELAAGGHVEAHALLVGEAGHGPAQERLGGVGHPVAPRRHRLATAPAEMLLVVDEQRRAVPLGEVEEVDATDPEVAVGPGLRRHREEVGAQGPLVGPSRPVSAMSEGPGHGARG